MGGGATERKTHVKKKSSNTLHIVWIISFGNLFSSLPSSTPTTMNIMTEWLTKSVLLSCEVHSTLQRTFWMFYNSKITFETLSVNRLIKNSTTIKKIQIFHKSTGSLYRPEDMNLRLRSYRPGNLGTFGFLEYFQIGCILWTWRRPEYPAVLGT